MKLHARFSLVRAIWLPLLLGSLATLPTTLNASNIAHASSSCTLYAASYGSSGNSGTSTGSPLTLSAAEARTVPGSVVCLLSGTYNLSSTFYITRSGTASSWITYRNYSGTAQLNWTGGLSSVVQVTSGTHYIQISGLTINGNNASSSGISCDHTTHLIVSGNTVSNNGGGGITSKACDYVTVSSNYVYHTGYGEGWGSGISLNAHYWSDSYQGFHSYVIDNIVSGTTDASSYHSDGNGIIMDTGGNTPPVLIANNLVYENGGRCINLFLVENIWVVHNTCYKNALNLLNSPQIGEISLITATHSYIVNNTVYGWQQHPPYFYASASQATFLHDAYYGGGSNYGLPSSVLSDANQMRMVYPSFVNAPYVNPTAGSQYASAVPPWQIGNGLQLQSTSALLGSGANPMSLTGSSYLQSGLGQYIYSDLAGAARPQNGRWDLGAYEYAGSSSSTSSSCPAVSWTSLVNTSASGSTLRKTGTSSAWDAGARGATTITSGNGSVQVTADATSTGRMFGLTRAYYTSSYVGITYALELQSNGTLAIYESGVYRAQAGSYAVGDVLKVAETQGVVRYYRNGTLLYTSGVTPTYPLYVAASIRDSRAQVANVSYCTS